MGLFEEAGKGLATVAFTLVVRTEVEAVNMCAVRGELLLKLAMDVLDVGSGIEAEGDAALIGDYEHAEFGVIQRRDGF